MSAIRSRVGRSAMVLGLLLLGGASIQEATPGARDVKERLGGVRVPFVANAGQVDAQVAYFAPTFAGTLFVTTAGELVHSLPGPASPRGDGERGRRPGWTLTETFAGGSARPAGAQHAAAGVSVFRGADPAGWRSGAATYTEVGLGEVWPGVEVALAARGDGVEKLFTVAPGTGVEQIRMRVAGAHALAVDAGGALIAETGLGPVTFTAPVAYQPHGSTRRAVAVRYVQHGSEYGFAVGPYDRTRPLVVDPLVQATYLGGISFDTLAGLAIHPATGDVYVAGLTGSDNFPGVAGGAQSTKLGNIDAFVARLNSGLTQLVQATFLGGSGADSATALAIHPATGDIYVGGPTDSGNFPGTAGGAEPTTPGVTASFVARLNSGLTQLLQATYLRGQPAGLAIHPTTGEVYVGGTTSFPDLPATAGGAQPSLAVAPDGFVARLNSGLTQFLQATYVGGSDGEFAGGLAIHPATGEIYVGGTTRSSDFPASAGGAQPAFAGASDAFVARLNSGLTQFLQSTYVGGSGGEFAGGPAIHPATGEIYVGGTTNSSDLPARAGGAQSALSGFSDAFVARLDSGLTQLVQTTYLGGSGGENAVALAIHPATGDVYVGGVTDSSDFPVTGGGGLRGLDDGFVSRLNNSLTELSGSTYLGGSTFDSVSAVAVHSASGEVYAAGSTFSPDFPGTAGGAQPSSGFNSDAFVARFTPDIVSTPIPTLSASMQVALLGLIVALGIRALRRRRQPA